MKSLENLAPFVASLTRFRDCRDASAFGEDEELLRLSRGMRQTRLLSLITSVVAISDFSARRAFSAKAASSLHAAMVRDGARRRAADARKRKGVTPRLQLPTKASDTAVGMQQTTCVDIC